MFKAVEIYSFVTFEAIILALLKSLILGSRAEDCIISVYRIVNPSKEIAFITSSQTMYNLDTDFRATGDQFFAKFFYVLTHRLQSFKLTGVEEVVLKAICIYSPGTSQMFF